MKILVIPEYGSSGGTMAFTKRLLEINHKNNIETAVLISCDQKTPAMTSFFKEENVEVFMASKRAPIFFYTLLSPFFDLIYCWKVFRSFKPDLIFVSTATIGIYSGISFYPVPAIFMFHAYPLSRMYLPSRLLWRLVARKKTPIVTVSEYSARQINNFLGIPDKSVKVVYNSCSPVHFKKSVKKLPIVLTVAHVSWYKNPDRWLSVAIEVIKDKPEVSFIWLGGGALMEKMKERVNALGLNDRIIFKGHNENVAEYYSQAMVYFQPSLLENHSISVVEAMAHGLPCVVSNAGGLPESVVNGETGFTSPTDNVDIFALNINKLLDDKGMRDRMGHAGKLRAEKNFSDSVQEKKILSLYKSCAKSETILE